MPGGCAPASGGWVVEVGGRTTHLWVVEVGGTGGGGGGSRGRPGAWGVASPAGWASLQRSTPAGAPHPRTAMPHAWRGPVSGTSGATRLCGVIPPCICFCCSERDGMVHFVEEEETYHTGGRVGGWVIACSSVCWLLPAACLPSAQSPPPPPPCRRDDGQAGRPHRPLH